MRLVRPRTVICFALSVTENDASANCGRGGCSGAILGYFEYEKYVRAQTASFSVCVDPEDVNGWSTCTTPGVSSGPVQIDLNCQCNDPTKDVETCPADCPFGKKRFCPLRKVHSEHLQVGARFVSNAHDSGRRSSTRASTCRWLLLSRSSPSCRTMFPPGSSGCAKPVRT